MSCTTSEAAVPTLNCHIGTDALVNGVLNATAVPLPEFATNKSS